MSFVLVTIWNVMTRSQYHPVIVLVIIWILDALWNRSCTVMLLELWCLMWNLYIMATLISTLGSDAGYYSIMEFVWLYLVLLVSDVLLDE